MVWEEEFPGMLLYAVRCGAMLSGERRFTGVAVDHPRDLFPHVSEAGVVVVPEARA